MKTLISIDPGKSSGLVVGTYSDTEPFKVTHAFQIEGGVEGFIKNVKVRDGYTSTDMLYYQYMKLPVPGFTSVQLGVEKLVPCGHPPNPDYPEDDDPCCYDSVFESAATVITEKFTARGSGNGFSYRTDALEPLRVEGAILAMGLSPEWVSPAQQYFMGGKSKAEKLKARDAWLREHKDLGYYITGKDVGCKDANDARSALAHCVSWLRRGKHKPTVDLFRKEDDDCK